VTASRKANGLRHAHAILTVLWFAMIPVAVATGWIGSIVFVSACSIYANAGAHFGAWQASRAETNA
jgi:hypothetical protein